MEKFGHLVFTYFDVLFLLWLFPWNGMLVAGLFDEFTLLQTQNFENLMDCIYRSLDG